MGQLDAVQKRHLARPSFDDARHRLIDTRKLFLLTHDHRHLREIDCSLALGPGPATAYIHSTESWGKSVHWPCIQCQSVMAVGDTAITVKKGRWAGPMSSLFLKMSMLYKLEIRL